ncbi:hypothetical protein HPP92_021914 [Vanilla planifolia]|uniref:Transcription repressor n=1 Tax=Vanilla planifolia TaxID=51239 RepID=A0A835UGR5_VANPL|nr:hypothetical protein HPP92_021914 [Vanilla planifolia]
MGKLKASMKCFHEAITNLRPTETICVQEAKTHSFREVDKQDSHQLPVTQRKEDSSSSSSLVSPSSATMTEQRKTLLPDGRISSKRFFFSPRNTNSIMEEVKQTGGGNSGAAGSFYEGSVVVPMVSEDPYGDFKISMAEMVEAHDLRDWRRLQELLHCYLRLNERKNHKVIVLAFVDLLMHLMAQDRKIFPLSAPFHLSPRVLDM